MFFLFGHPNQLNDMDIKYALESYLRNSKISYAELIIKESHEITEQEYISRTQYI